MSGKGNDNGKGGKKKGYARTAKQLRYLFATGVLKNGGKGKDGKRNKPTYDRDRAASLKSAKGSKSKAGVVGGSKAAGLRSGAGGGKVDHSATRAARIAAGLQTLGAFAGKRVSGLRQANPNKGFKEMPAKFDGKFADTGKPFKAGERIYYGSRAGDYRGRAYSRPGNRTPGELKAGEKFSRTGKVAVSVAQSWSKLVNKDPRYSMLAGRTKGKAGVLYGSTFRDHYRSLFPNPKRKA